MFGSQKAYGGNHQQNNNTYGNTSYYSSSQTNDSFWGNNQQQQRSSATTNTRLNYSSAAAARESGTSTISAAAIANDSLYGYQANSNVDSDNSTSKTEKYGNIASFASTTARKTTWASIASQPAKSQPKSLKLAKMAAGLTGTTSKHLPPTVAMDAMSWDSPKNGVSIGPGGTGKSSAGPLPTSASVISGPPTSVPVPVSPTLQQQHDDDLYSSMADIPSSSNLANNPPLPSAQQQQSVTRENSWNSNNNGNGSPVGSIGNSSDSRQTPTYPTMPQRQSNANYNEHNGNHSQSTSLNKYNQCSGGSSGNIDYHHPSKSMVDNHNQSFANNNKNLTHHHNQLLPPPAMRDLEPEDDEEEEENDVHDAPDPDDTNVVDQDLSHMLLEKLCIENNYNPKEFNLNLRQARFFIIKSYSEDDIHRSIKYSIWCSTEHGNKRLDNAFRQQEDKGPIYLFFSVNRSGHFCGVAQMMSHVDYNASSGVWSQDKWKGQFKVKWIYVKDVPNDELRHITLENNENKPVTNSRDTQEVLCEKGKLVISIIHRYDSKTSIFDDFLHYEKKQVAEQQQMNMQHHRRLDMSSPPPPHINNYYANAPKQMQSPNSQHYQPPLREPNNGPIQVGSYRGNNNYNSKSRSYNDGGGGGGGGHHRNDYRNNDGYSQGPPPPLPSQHRNNFRNNNYGGGDGRHIRNHDYQHRGGDYGRVDPYYQRDSGYRGGPDYYAPPPQRDYPPPPTNDYPRGGGDYIRGNHHDRMQSWRN